MKITKHIINTSIILLIGIMSGCNDFLDTYPKNVISNATFWSSPKDAESYLIGLYGYLPGIGELKWDRISDIAVPTSPASEDAWILRGEHDASISWVSIEWDQSYRAIRGVNSFLENVEDVPDYDVDKMQLASAQARFIRAFFYARLVMQFGDIPLITKTISDIEAKELTQTSAEQIWNFVDSELSEISNHLPLSYSTNNIGRITRGASIALNARSMLFAGRWDRAATLAKQVIDLGVYSLHQNFEEIFSYKGQNNSEVILDRQYSKDVASHGYFNAYAPRSMMGNGNNSPTSNLIDAFQTINGLPIGEDPLHDPMNPYLNRDPRLKYSVYIPAFSNDSYADIIPTTGNRFDPRPGSGTPDEVEVDYTRSKTGFYIKKYINMEDAYDRSNGGTNFILIRYAEVLLIYAEAKIELNQIDESVFNSINMIRNGRDDVEMPSISVGKSQDELRKIVRQERLFELALEGSRYWDIIRWGVAHELLQGPIPGMEYVRSGQTEVKKLEYRGYEWAFRSPRNYLFPIPTQEIALNPNLVQNPGY